MIGACFDSVRLPCIRVTWAGSVRTRRSRPLSLQHKPSNMSSIQHAPVHARTFTTATSKSNISLKGASFDELEAAALRVVELEKEAAALHHKAQQLNKEGRFAEAQEVYTQMHALEDEACSLSKQVGCVQCLLGDAGSGSGGSSACSVDLEELRTYKQLYRPHAWDSVVAAAPGCALSSNQLQQRAVSSIVGSAVADAAAMGVHWVYDRQLLRELEEEVQQQAPASISQSEAGLEFLDPPRSPFYSYGVGRNTPYGEQTLVLLHSLAVRGGLDCHHYAQLFHGMFGDGFDGYRDVSTKGFLRNYERGMMPPLSGADDAQANCIARLAPLVAMFAGHPQLMRYVQYATRVTQNTDAACAWACAGAAVLEAILLGQQPAAAVQATIRELQQGPESRLCSFGDLNTDIAKHLQRALELAETSPEEAIAELGCNCHMPNALQMPLQVVLHIEALARAARNAAGRTANDVSSSSSSSSSGAGRSAGSNGTSTAHHADAEDWFMRGIRLAIREGGCCASRASFVGACLGAMHCVPEAWAARYSAYEQVLSNATVVAQRQTL